MSPLELVLCYTIGVASNASWDAIKATFGMIAKSRRVNVEKLWTEAFYGALDQHAAAHDDVAARIATLLREACRRDPQILTLILSRLSYDDYGSFIASISSGQFNLVVAEEIVRVFGPEIHEADQMLVTHIVADALTYYRLALLNQIGRDEELRVILLQSLKIDAIQSSVESIKREIANRHELAIAGEALRAELLLELRDLHRLLEAQYSESQKQLDAGRAAFNREIVIAGLARILKAKGYSSVPNQMLTIDLLAESAGVMGVRIGVQVDMGPDPISLSNILLFKEQILKARVVVGYYVAEAEFTDDAISACAAQPLIRLVSLESFVNGLVDFGAYLDNIISQHDRDKLFKEHLYIPPACIRGYTDEPSDLRATVDDLFDSHATRRIALLGDFGHGKTTFCNYYATDLADSLLSRSGVGYLPVVVPLSRYERLNDIRATVVHILQAQGVDINLSLFAELLASGRFVFLFDGLDEMTVRADKMSILANLRSIEELADAGPNMIILTCRTHYFRDPQEEDYLKGYVKLHVEPWRRQQLEVYLQALFVDRWAAVYEQIRGHHSLRELCRTPLFVDMVVSSLQELKTDTVTVSDLFRVYTERWIKAQDQRSRMDTAEKREFMFSLATLMFYNNKFAIHFSELRKYVKTTFEVQLLEDLDYYDNDVRTCSFLTRDAGGNYRFCHRVFMEYFVASSIVADLLSHEKGGQDIRDQLPLFGRKKLTGEIYRFIAESTVTTDGLWNLIGRTRGKSFAEVAYLGANAATVLKYRGEIFRCRNLEGTVLRDVDLSNSDLTGCNFKEADLYTANLNNTVLDDADMRGATLTLTSIKGLGGIADFAVSASGKCYLATMQPEIRVWEGDLPQLDTVEFAGHSDAVWTLELTPDGRKLISGGRDHTVRLWDTERVELLRTLDGHSDNVWSVAAAPDGALFASASSDHLVKIWEDGLNSSLAVLDEHSDEVRCVRFVDMSHVVSCGLDGQVVTWKWKADERRACHLSRALLCLSVCKERGLVAVGDSDGYVTLISLGSMTEQWALRLHEGAVRTLEFCMDGAALLTGGGDKQVLLTRLENPEDTKVIATHDGIVNRIRVAHDGSTVLSVGYEDMLIATDLRVLMHHKVNLGQLLYGESGRFSCKGLMLAGSAGLVRERVKYLEERGAVR